MQFHVSVIFTSRGNAKTQVLRGSVTFPERKLPSHVSAMFKLADFRSCAFPSRFCKRIYSCLLHLDIYQNTNRRDGSLNNNES